MINIFIRGSVLFMAAVLAVRVMGKREIGQLQPFELVIAIMIADLASTPMQEMGIPLLYGIVPLLALVILHEVITMLSLKSQRFRSFVSGSPVVLMKDGVMQEKELRRICFSITDLLEELRGQGYLNPAEVGTAIMETGGKVSVFPKAPYRPVSPNDMGLDAGIDGIPLTLILDGRLQAANLKAGGLTENWLLKRIQTAGVNTFKEIFMCSLDTQGVLMVQAKNKAQVHYVQALDQAEIGW
jgi:Predicted membrane protein